MNLSIDRMEVNVTSAALVASTAHQGQLDKRGEPILFHVLRVGGMGKNYEEMMVGYLHDVLEDSDVTSLNEIRREFGDTIADAVDAITQRPGEKYHSEYIPRVSQNPLATQVKMNDLTDNMEPWRQDFEGHEGLMEKHKKAFRMLWETKYNEFVGKVDAVLAV